MTSLLRFISCTALLVLPVPLWADQAALSVPAAQTAPAPAQSAQPVLDTLVGRQQVIGVTLRGGSRFLGRVLSADHGLYLIQTFHYVSAPYTTTQTMTVTGRNRRRSQVKQQVVTQNTIADDVAVRALLSGVAGAAFRPLEQAGTREVVAPGDVLCLQALSPPSKKTSSPDWTMKMLWASPDLPAAKTPPGKPLPK